MKNSQVLTSEDPKTNSQDLILEDLKENLITAINNFDIFNPKKKMYCLFNKSNCHIHADYIKKLKDMLSFGIQKILLIQRPTISMNLNKRLKTAF